MRDRLVKALEGIEMEIFSIPDISDLPQLKNLKGKLEQAKNLAKEGCIVAALEVLE